MIHIKVRLKRRKMIAFALYVEYARRMLSYEGKKVRDKVLDNVLSYLNWDKNGRLLDIGCGSFDAAISNLVFHEVRSQPISWP